MGKDQTAEVAWNASGTPVATRFDDPYFSLENGLAETRHVFLDGNDLPARLTHGFHVAELGFGTGLNALALALSTDKRVHFTSFEAYPIAVTDMAKALAAFPEVQPLVPQLLDGMTGTKFRLASIEIELVFGDARQTLPAWNGRADAWFLDGFSPAKNPELWQPDLMQSAYDHTTPGGTFASYTAAGHVRRALSEAGFTVERTPGFGRKRHMIRGVK